MIEVTTTQTSHMVASVAQTTFSYGFKINTTAEIEWYVDGVLQTYSTHYSLTGVGDDAGGTAVFVTPMTGGEIVWGRRVPLLLQSADYTESGKFPAASHELALDKLTMQTLYLREVLDRCLRWLPSTNLGTVVNTQLPDPGTNSGKFLKLTAAGISAASISSDPIADPLGTKGDILGHDGSDAQAISVGADNTILTALASQTLGVKYQTLSTLMNLVFTTRGDLLRVGSSGVERYAKGTSEQHLSGDGTDSLWVQIPWAQGQCQLTLSGGNLVLSPRNGNIVVVKTGSTWGVKQVPEATITLSPSTFTLNTNYYIYLYNNSGTLTLEGSTTAPARDTTTGFQVKDGDPLRLLVGFARCVSGPAWADSATQRFTRSWFHDNGIHCLGEFSTDRTTTSATFATVNAEIDVNFISWGGEIITIQASGCWSSSADASCGITGAINTAAFDRGVILRRLNGTTTGQTDFNYFHLYDQAGAGNHKVGLFAKTSTGTLTLKGGAGGDGVCALRINIPGRR